MPKRREDGELNYTIRRLKDKVATRSVPTGEIELRGSEAWLLGLQDRGVHLILEVLNLSRATNALGSMAIVSCRFRIAVPARNRCKMIVN